MSVPAVRPTSSQKSSLPVPLRLAAGTYLTDERNLFRCVSVAPGATALLEDCHSLELVVFPLEELARARLRVIRTPL